MAAKELLKKLTGIVSVIPREYIDALLFLHSKWNSTGADWAINGDLAMALRTVDIQPDCIEVVCSENDAQTLYNAVKEDTTEPIATKTKKLLQNAVHEGNQYPIYTKSRYFEFKTKGIPVRVQGDLQFKVGDCEWGDVFEFQPEYVNVVGKKTAVVPLSVLYQLYNDVGWTEKTQLIQQVLQRQVARC
jgi:hypothetical protein